MPILHLTLKKLWFDMIYHKVKLEEYREIKPYWDKRLAKEYDIVQFVNGYGKNKPTIEVELKNIKRGIGNQSWGAPKEEVYILSLGKILSEKNIPPYSPSYIDSLKKTPNKSLS